MTTRIVEGQLPYTGGTGIEIDTNKVISILLREEDNLIKVNGDNELYTDLQLAVNITPTDEFPVGVTVGKVLQADGWDQNGLILHWQTTSGDYARWLYGADGELYFDGGTGTWKQVYYSDEVDALFTALRGELATVAFTGDYNDLINRPAFLQMQADWDQTDNTQPDYIKNKPTIPTVNDATLTIQKNGVDVATFTANSSTNATANITVPNVINNVTSISTSDALSANQGKSLQDQIDNLKAIGRFLSLWDASTGQPISFPLSTPYNYQTGDYYLVETISSATPPVNYRPSGVQYTGTASSTVETEELEVGDLYIYDGTVWLLQMNHGKSVTFANIAGQPEDNAALDSALDAKQDVLTAGAGISIDANNEISNTGVLSSNNTYDNMIHLSQADYDALVTKDPDTFYSTPNQSEPNDLNTKTFELTGTTGQTNIDTAQDIYNWYSIGNNPLILYNNYTYVLANATASALIFRGGLSQENQNSSTFIKQDVIQINFSSNTVTSIATDVYVAGGSFLRLGQNYNTPYTPIKDGDPTSKKYVDEHGAVIPVYHLNGGFSSNITFSVDTGGDYRIYVTGYHGTTIDRTLTLTVDNVTVGTYTSNLIEHFFAHMNFTASAGSTVVLTISSTSNFSVTEVYVEKINIQSGYLTATVN